MANTSLFNEKHIRYIQRTLKVSRREIIETINLSRISAANIAEYLKKKNFGLTAEKQFA